MNKTLLPYQAPVALCRLLSPYTPSDVFNRQLDELLAQPERLNQVIECANQQMMIATLYACLRGHRHWEQLPAPLRDYLHYQHTFMQARNQRLRAQALAIITTLNQAGITPLLMKGGDTLFYPLYPDQSCRFMSDLDILLPSGTMPLAKQGMAAQGYAIPTQYQHLNEGPKAHHALPLYKTGHDCAIELHYQPLNYKSGDVLDNESAFANSQALTLPEQPTLQVRTLSATHKVLHSFIHSEICHGADRKNHLSIRQLDYFTRLLRHYQEAVDAPWLVQQMKTHGYEDAFARYTDKAQRLCALPRNVLPVERVAPPTQAQENRYQTALKSAIIHHYPGLRFRRGISHLLTVYERQRLSGQYPVDTAGGYALAILKKTGELLNRCTRPRKLAGDLKQLLF